MADAFEEIVKACLEDEQFFDVVRKISSFSQDQKNEFLLKLKKYFFERTDESSIEAYRFYLFILEDENAQKVVQQVEEKREKLLKEKARRPCSS